MHRKWILFSVLLGFGAATASAQILADFSVSPELPRDPGPVRFVVSGTSDQCVPESVYPEVTPSERGPRKGAGRIRLFLGGCLDKPAGSAGEFLVTTEPTFLSEGRYEVEIIDATGNTPTMQQSVVRTGELDVLPYDDIPQPATQSACADLPSLPRNASVCSDVPPGNRPSLPCTLQKDLLHAAKGEPTEWNWWGHLDADFSPAWDTGNFGSNNLPVLAAAINLFTGRAGFDSVRWWTEFLTCQTGAAGCPYANDVKWRGGHEIMSPIYDSATVTAVVAVHYWGSTRNNAAIRDLARTYLKQTWALYTLTAGSGPAARYTFDKFTKTSTVCPYTYSRAVTTANCDLSGNGVLMYNGPFLALSGARASSAASPCGSNSDPLLVRAIAWPNVTRTREDAEQYDLLDWLECNWNDATYGGINVYANDSTRRSFLRSHVSGASNDASTLVAIIGTAKFIRPYHFLKWSGGERMTLLTDNPQTCVKDCTAALYATIYYPSSQSARMLYPWPGHPRREITHGYGKLIPTARPYTSVEASNRDLAEGEAATCEHDSTVVSMTPPAGSPLFEVVVDQSGARRLY